MGKFKKTIFVVPYQHFDIIWRRSVDYYRQLREEIILMVFKMLRKFPEFKFDLPPKKWTQRRVSGRITTGSKTGGVLWRERGESISVLTKILSFRP